MNNIDQFVGMTLADATTMANEKNFIIRVVIQDGRGRAGTCDYRTDRINVEVNEGVIARIISVG